MENSPTTSILRANALELSKVVNSDIEIDRNYILVSSSRPVVVKAKMEQLMKEKKMVRGTVTQFNSCVLYELSEYALNNYYKS